MSRTSPQAGKAAPDRTERVQRWTAALATALLHMLLVLLVMPPPPIPMTTLQGGAGGSAMKVTLIDETLSPPPPEPEPIRKPISRKKPKAPRAIKRPPATPVAQATVPMPPEAADTSDTSTPESEPPDSSRNSVDRPAHDRGQPPGMRPDAAARASAALAALLGSSRGRSTTGPSVGPNMEVDGFHVYYDLVNETRLRTWRDQGMTELFLPMPGTRRLMVCPLEVALRRGSGACRMVEMDSPELKSIGDAREAINVERVYQWGEMVWSGPGRYR